MLKEQDHYLRLQAKVSTLGYEWTEAQCRDFWEWFAGMAGYEFIGICGIDEGIIDQYLNQGKDEEISL